MDPVFKLKSPNLNSQNPNPNKPPLHKVHRTSSSFPSRKKKKALKKLTKQQPTVTAFFPPPKTVAFRMFITNPSSLFFSAKLSALRCRASAADVTPTGPTFPRKWFQFPSISSSSAEISIGIGIDSDSAANDGPARRAGKNGGKVNAKEKKWSRDRESYLTDDSDALPLPMTYPDSSPVPPEVVDQRLQCNPVVEVFISYLLCLFQWKILCKEFSLVASQKKRFKICYKTTLILCEAK